MKRFLRPFLTVFLSLLLVLSLVGCSSEGVADAIVKGSAYLESVLLEEDTADGEFFSWDELFEETEAATVTESSPTEAEQTTEAPDTAPVKGNAYYTKEDVALYLHTYHELPKNYLTKNEAMALGWDSSKGNLWDVTDKGCIGGDRFGNYEGALPKGSYRECDVNYQGGYRGSDRLIFDTNWNIYYTGDHYESFTLLYHE